MNNWFEDLENEWRYDTFMAAAFNDERDFDEYLDDEETHRWILDDQGKPYEI